MNILSYDYHSAFESSVNHHSPLYPLGEDDEYNFEAALSIVSTIPRLKSAKIFSNKEFYGFTYSYGIGVYKMVQ